MDKIYGQDDGFIVIECTRWGKYRITPDGLDLAMRRFSDASVSDLQWHLLEESGYELTHWDIMSKSHLLIIWGDTHGFGYPEDSPTGYADSVRGLTQEIAKLDERGKPHGIPESEIRAMGEWFGDMWADDYMNVLVDEWWESHPHAEETPADLLESGRITRDEFVTLINSDK
jgi:hypothetical protein